MPNKISRFWQDLKRRNVVRVITVYTGAAFVILSLVDMVREPFELPNWSFKLVVVLLAIGLIIAVILSWIYDVHPDGGLVKTEPAHKVKPEDIPKSSNNWKIASYISFVVIAGLIVLNIFGRNRGARIDESLAKSIAVLVFYNNSGDSDQDNMCVSLTNDIILNLFKVKSFDVVKSLTSVLRFKDALKSSQEIAQALNVNYILEGTYRRIGERLKVTATLIEANSGNAIWSHEYDPPYNEVMGIPGEIALQIADNLKSFISEDVRESINRNPTDNIEAYEYLRQAKSSGQELLGSRLTWNQRMELAEKAKALDPEYADAYAYIGYLIIEQAAFSGKFDMLSAYLKAEPYVNKAMEIDPDNVMANWVLAGIDFFIKKDYVKVDEIGSKYETFFISDSALILGTILFRLEMGMFENVLSLVKEDSYWGIRTLIMSGDTSHARALFERRNVLDEYNPEEWSELYIYFHEFDSAIYCFESMMADGLQDVFVPRYQADLAVAYYKAGQVDQAKRILSGIIRRSDTTSAGSPAYFTGWYYSWIGEPDSAFFWLEKAVKNGSIEITWLKVDPAFKSLQDDPHYWDLYERTGHQAFDEYLAGKKE
jgi:adenylate cyclase